jgi:hypothetical protein
MWRSLLNYCGSVTYADITLVCTTELAQLCPLASSLALISDYVDVTVVSTTELALFHFAAISQ